MPVPDQRDPELTGETCGVAHRQLPAADRGSSRRGPDASQQRVLGGDAHVRSGLAESGRQQPPGAAGREGGAEGFQIFPEPRFAEQFRLLQILAGTQIPVPAVHWQETDPAVLGAPFYVMSRVDGDVPTDMPPYHSGGWLTEVSPAERESIWWSGVSVLTQVHALDVGGLGLVSSTSPATGPPGCGSGSPTTSITWTGRTRDLCRWRRPHWWLREHRPPKTREPVLLWGDSRIGNIIFTGGQAAAVLDWEMATLGQPEEDLAWFLLLDRHHSEGIGVPRLPGFPDAAQTIARYGRLTGRTLATWSTTRCCPR